ncbi:rho GTPase activating protein [Nesidiocoris tenuis]|uniref:Rho GTPase activating protein n=1 Tax=Nesidiocoris tenuis TaxID=355587 RepID=A0ABN7BBU0_9HEMI|nr:rho GTPase activating protein [Nesidiocoris tenuis]
MHLSFVLDLTLSDTESEGTPDKPKSRPLKWSIAPFTKRIKNLTKEIVKEGETCTPLTKNMLTQANKLITFLSQEENIVQEGLFRRSGKLTRQQELKASLVKNDPVDLSCYSVHDIATVLKGMLAELPEPLLTETYYPAYSQIAELCCGSPTTGLSPPVKARILRSLQLLCLLLPRENRWLLKNLLSLLHSTAGHEDSNRMSPQNLATLFTPHLLCSRKLSAEGFHSTAQTLSCVVVFMINESEEIFGIPEVLATDIHAYWENKEKNTFLERSISEAKTVFSFTDRALSLKEDAVNPTETALAQLYAHIQGLPDSSHKKRLIKQFNKENGNGTPRTKSLGVTIKKNIFSKNSKTKGLPDFSRLKNDSLPPPNNILSPKAKIARTPLATKLRLNLAGGCSDGKKSSSSSLDMPATENSDSLSMSESSHAESSEEADQLESFPNGPDIFETPSRHFIRGVTPAVDVLTSTPSLCATSAVTPIGPPDDMSPITRSAQRMPKAMQEAMITPRSRKPVVALSGSNLCQPSGNSVWTAKELSWGQCPSEILEKDVNLQSRFVQDTMAAPQSRGLVAVSNGPEPCRRNNLTWIPSQAISYGRVEKENVTNEKKTETSALEDDEEDPLTSPFRDYLFSRSVLTTSPVDLSFSSRTGDFDPSTSGDDTGARLSDSLLYILDGGSPTSLRNSASRLKRSRDHSQDETSRGGKRSGFDSSGLGCDAITETSL